MAQPPPEPPTPPHLLRFKRGRFREGYNIEDVDEELDRVAAAFQGFEAARRQLEPPTPRDHLRFTQVRFQPSYDVAEVDEFFRRAHHALECRDGSITPSDVHSVRFRTKFKAGYEIAPVDEELDRIAGALQRLEPPAGG
jgi:DivIVA domain-containing protein